MLARFHKSFKIYRFQDIFQTSTTQTYNINSLLLTMMLISPGSKAKIPIGIQERRRALVIE